MFSLHFRTLEIINPLHLILLTRGTNSFDFTLHQCEFFTFRNFITLWFYNSFHIAICPFLNSVGLLLVNGNKLLLTIASVVLKWWLHAERMIWKVHEELSEIFGIMWRWTQQLKLVWVRKSVCKRGASVQDLRKGAITHALEKDSVV